MWVGFLFRKSQEIMLAIHRRWASPVWFLEDFTGTLKSVLVDEIVKTTVYGSGLFLHRTSITQSKIYFIRIDYHSYTSTYVHTQTKRQQVNCMPSKASNTDN